MIGGSKSGKMSTFINLINEQNDIDKIYLYAKGLGEHQILIKQRKNVGIKHFNDSKAFIQCSNTMDDFMRILMITTQKEIKKILTVLDDMIADIMTNKKFHPKIEELFERCKKLNISLVCIAQSCFAFLKDVRLNFV